MQAVCKSSGSKPIMRATFAITAAVALSCTVTAFAETMETDAFARAKMVKEKIRASGLERIAAREQRKAEEQLRSFNQNNCESQNIGNIGNIEATGQPGAVPREEFVFAPNAINFVGSGACR